MSKPTLFIDATVFLGMHHEDEALRARSLAFFRSHFESPHVHMNHEQIGICDAVIWQQSRQVQDLYYPFMDVLHSNMKIHRAGYTSSDMQWAIAHQAELGLRTEQALLAAQVVLCDGQLVTHDVALRKLPALVSRVWQFDGTIKAPPFPPELEALYEASRCFTHTGRELALV